VTEAELKKHLDAAEQSPKQIASAVLIEQTSRLVCKRGLL
jgi:hypothetical protein